MAILIRSIGVVIVAIALAGCLAAETPAASVDRQRADIYLDAQRYPSLIVELDYMETVPPAADALAHLDKVLRGATGRTDVRIVTTPISAKEVPPEADRAWRSEELQELAAAQLDLAPLGGFANGAVAVIHVIYVEGEYAEDADFGGLATLRSAFLFRSRGTLPQLPSLPNETSYMERALLTHEVGHLLGLVDNGVEMVRPHEDPNSESHSVNPESVMYHSIDSFASFFGRLDPSQAPPIVFDADDLADLRAHQAKLRSR